MNEVTTYLEERWHLVKGHRLVLCLAPIAFLVIALLIGAETAGHSALHDSISSLAWTSNKDWETANFLIAGVLVAALGFLVERTPGDLPARRHTAWAIVVVGVVMIVCGLFKADLHHNHTTTHGAIHALAFAVAVLVILSAQFRIAKNEGWRRPFGRYTILSLAVEVPSFLVNVGVSHWKGIAELVLLGAMFSWIGIAAFRHLSVRALRREASVAPVTP